MTSESQAYIYVQLPSTLNTVPAALLKVEKMRDGMFVGRFRYGDRFLERKDAVVLDPFKLSLGSTVHEITKLKGQTWMLAESYKANRTKFEAGMRVEGAADALGSFEGCDIVCAT